MNAPELSLSILDLEPRKYDLHDFFQFGYSKMARHVEATVLRRTEFSHVVILPLHKVYQDFGALTCDGMHFGSSFSRKEYGCDGYPVVNDLLTQVMLSYLCVEGFNSNPLQLGC